MHVCQTDSSIDDTHLSRTSSLVRWGVMTQALNDSLFFSLSISHIDPGGAGALCPTECSSLCIKVINNDSGLYQWCNRLYAIFREVGRLLVDVLRAEDSEECLAFRMYWV